ncbi:hypothetical protein C4D60_Mb06t29040 [Musa balbisiana]|uniref:Uncharacterized protein n=1 Tax=Musa balbisiana TaxID=52838 RepID=A0A4S8IRH2_MUSBA|nr:hypothetical protein C4D60_Mb06t29040 [Musa balbisiana]
MKWEQFKGSGAIPGFLLARCCASIDRSDAGRLKDEVGAVQGSGVTLTTPSTTHQTSEGKNSLGGCFHGTR